MRPTWTGRRQAERRECSIKAQAHMYDGSPSIDCIVTDFSPTGAKVIFPEGKEPPSAFDLYVASRGDTRHALVRWKTPEAIGVEFIQGRGTTEDQRLSDVMIRLSRIEEEMRAMRAEVVLAKANAGASVEPSRGVAVTEPIRADNAAQNALAVRLHLLEERGTQDRAEWEMLADRLAAFEQQFDALPMAEQTIDAASLALRITSLEVRNEEIMRGLKQALTLLGDLCVATAPPLAKTA